MGDEGNAIQPWEMGDGDALTVNTLVEQVALVRSAKDRVMQKDVHYGVIPGTGKKPTLLKPGAETLLFLFRYRPVINDTDVAVEDHGGGHRTYSVVCHVYNRHGEEVGTGVGTCSTMETRYRFRSENTGRPVPGAYWKDRDPNVLGGPQFTVRKKGENWLVFQQVEHPNPVDYWNTCEKMAKKRALVDAALTTTAASEHFTQDVEDNPALFGGSGGESPTAVATPPPVQNPQPTPAPASAPPAAPQSSAPPAHTNGGGAPANGSTPPAGAQEAPSGGGQVVTGMVVAISSNEGTSPKGKKYTRTGIKLNDGAWYNTFDLAPAEEAARARDNALPVRVVYAVNQYGPQIKSLEVMTPDFANVPPPSESDMPPGIDNGGDDGDIPF